MIGSKEEACCLQRLRQAALLIEGRHALLSTAAGQADCQALQQCCEQHYRPSRVMKHQSSSVAAGLQ
jgi:hypothetical protein